MASKMNEKPTGQKKEQNTQHTTHLEMSMGKGRTAKEAAVEARQIAHLGLGLV